MTGAAGRDHLLPDGSGATGPGIVLLSPLLSLCRAAPSRRRALIEC